jgi:hypothetical protein
MAVASGRPGIAYVGYLKGGPVFVSRSPRRFSLYLRVFSVRRGWLSSPIRVSRKYGNRNGWPGGHNRDLGDARPPGHAQLGHSQQSDGGPDLGRASAACLTPICATPNRKFRVARCADLISRTK